MNVLATILVLSVIAVAVVFAIVQMRRGVGGCGSCGGSSKDVSCGGFSKGGSCRPDGSEPFGGSADVRSGDSDRSVNETCESGKRSRHVSGGKCTSCSNHDCPFCN